MRERLCLGIRRGEERRRAGLATKLSSVCATLYQLEDDGVLKLGDPKAAVHLGEVSRRELEAQSKAPRTPADTQQHKGAGGIYAELETE